MRHLAKFLGDKSEPNHADDSLSLDRTTYVNPGVHYQKHIKCSPKQQDPGSLVGKETLGCYLPIQNERSRKELFVDTTHIVHCGAVQMPVLVSGQNNIMNVSSNPACNPQAVLVIKDTGFVDRNHNILHFPTVTSHDNNGTKSDDDSVNMNSSFDRKSDTHQFVDNSLLHHKLNYESMWRPW